MGGYAILMTEVKDSTPAISLKDRFERLTKESGAMQASMYDDDQMDPEEEERALQNIENAYRTLNRRLAATENNRWGYSKLGWYSKKLVSKHLNSLKHGIFSVYPIPCKKDGCPYGPLCPAFQNKMDPPYGEPCIIEVTKIENLIVSYSNDFKLDTCSTSDKVFLQELIQIDLLMDRCQNLMAQDVTPLQEVAMGISEDGEVYTQPVVSRYLDVWERMSKRRQSILNDMLATRKSKLGTKQDPRNDDDILTTIIEASKNLFDEEEVPEQYRIKE